MRSLPERDRYTICDLINERWRLIWPDITYELLEQLIDDGEFDVIRSREHWLPDTAPATIIHIPLQEIKRYEAKHGIEISPNPPTLDEVNHLRDIPQKIAAAEIQPEAKKPHEFTPEERIRGDRKGCLQYAVEAYLDNNVDGGWEGFRKFINAKLELPKEEILCKKQSYNYFFEKVTNTTLLLKHPKLGAKDGKQACNQHSADHVRGVIRKEKLVRKKVT